MNNPFQEQLLKAGLVTKQQVHKAKQDKTRKKKQQKAGKTQPADETLLKVQKAAADKARRDRELNQRRQEQARQKSISIEINQLISSNSLKRDENCDIVYNFEHDRKVRRLYVNPEMKQQLVQGKLGIARIEGRYELVPRDIAEKIQQRNKKRVILFDEDSQEPDDDDPYAAYTVPDDLTW